MEKKQDYYIFVDGIWVELVCCDMYLERELLALRRFMEKWRSLKDVTNERRGGILFWD